LQPKPCVIVEVVDARRDVTIETGLQALSIEGEHAMTRKIFVNLPVKDLKRSMSFFKEPGFQFNPQFTDDTSACMVIADDIYAMAVMRRRGRLSAQKGG
jgi:hypothetical protein